MKIIECLLLRETATNAFTLGQFYIDGDHFAYTCEDKDRHLELGGEKVPKETAIPRGRYRLTLSMSQRFCRIMPEVVGVPHFSGVRVHGGNTAADTEGCPLIGADLTPNGVHNCRDVVDNLIRRIKAEESVGNMVYLTVR